MKMKFEFTDALHIVACLLCAFCVSAILAHTTAEPTPCIVGGWLCGMFLGVGKEFGDSRASGNAWSWSDMFYNFIGATAGCWGGLLTSAIWV